MGPKPKYHIGQQVVFKISTSYHGSNIKGMSHYDSSWHYLVEVPFPLNSPRKEWFVTEEDIKLYLQDNGHWSRMGDEDMRVRST